MKIFKIKFLIPCLTTCSLFISLISCNKNEIIPSSNEKINKLNSELKNINAKYLHRETLFRSTVKSNTSLLYNGISLTSSKNNGINTFASGGTVTTPPDPTQPIETGFSFKRFCAVFSADVGGAWAGSWAGDKIGGAIGSLIPGAGTGAGAAAGAVAGGVIVGAAASYAASDVVPDTTLNLVPVAIPFAPTVEESADEGHNRVLNLLISSSAVVPTENEHSQNLFDTTYLTNNESIIVSNCQNLNNTTNIFSQPQIETSKLYVAGNIDDNFITTVSNNFFDGLEYFQTSQEVSDFIDSYEMYVNSTSNLTQEQKQYIQVALEASKGSLSFWSPLIGH